MKLALLAPAKVNLTLEVLGHRADGFHEIQSIVQTISLYDRLQAEPSDALTLDAPATAGPRDANLASRAAHRLARHVGGRRGARLLLDKRIPVAAGLGGGSSDAAAVLRLVRHLWRRSTPCAELVESAADLGSDVPLFLAPPAARLSGRGERVEWLPPLAPGVFILLVVPPLKLENKTAQVYGQVRPRDYSDGQRTEAAAAMLRAGRTLPTAVLFNGLEPASHRAFPELRTFQRQLEALTASRFLLAGAGPTLMRLLDSPAEADPLSAHARALGASVHLVRPLSRLPGITAVGPQ